MRKIEYDMLTAIIENRNFSSANTRVSIDNDSTFIFLHDNLICIIHNNDKKVQITDAGWSSVTTKSRLNAIGSLLGFSIYQKNFYWFVDHCNLNNQVWSGEWLTLPFDRFHYSAYNLHARLK